MVGIVRKLPPTTNTTIPQASPLYAPPMAWDPWIRPIQCRFPLQKGSAKGALAGLSIDH
jgi:hypothetical protein